MLSFSFEETAACSSLAGSFEDLNMLHFISINMSLLLCVGLFKQKSLYALPPVSKAGVQLRICNPIQRCLQPVLIV